MEREAPIAIQEEQLVSRRQFTKVLSLGGLAALAGGLWLFLRARLLKPVYPEKVAARIGEIPLRGSKIFPYPTDTEPCILLRPSDDTYVAYSRICTHISCPLFYRPQDNLLECPCHQGAFSVADGSVLQGPPPRPLPRVILERRDQDLVATGMVKG